MTSTWGELRWLLDAVAEEQRPKRVILAELHYMEPEYKGWRGWLRRKIVLAAPTCTLWRYSYNIDAMYFLFWPQWQISSLEYAMVPR